MRCGGVYLWGRHHRSTAAAGTAPAVDFAVPAGLGPWTARGGRRLGHPIAPVVILVTPSVLALWLPLIGRPVRMTVWTPRTSSPC
ncbi:hypothetical protein [Kitasatospora sp. NPDC017646]|uniref:hypothetical protein n=1 Tax=Kitasatospora sp. NPDC017646 TaxID=3364024 RepID=UPI0037B9F541